MFKFSRDANIELVKKANAALDLDREIAAVRFIFTKEEFERLDSPQLEGKMPYCKMIVKATRGDTMKANFDNFGCFGGARALGIVDIDTFYQSGRFFEPRGLYKDIATSRYVTERIERIDHEVYGLWVGPLKECSVEPDVVIFITKPYQIMRLVQGYAYSYGTCSSIKMVGNQAICAESTAHPYNHNDMNLSSLCKGARGSGMDVEEMSLGIVYNKFAGLIEGLCMTISAIETNDNKEKIQEKLNQSSIKDIPVIKNTNYGMPFFKRDFPYFDNKRKDNQRDYEESFINIFDEKEKVD